MFNKLTIDEIIYGSWRDSRIRWFILRILNRLECEDSTVREQNPKKRDLLKGKSKAEIKKIADTTHALDKKFLENPKEREKVLRKAGRDYLERMRKERAERGKKVPMNEDRSVY